LFCNPILIIPEKAKEFEFMGVKFSINGVMRCPTKSEIKSNPFLLLF
jgi:hypothetical protein